MLLTRLRSSALILGGLLLLPFALPVRAGVVAPGAVVEGKTLGEWSAEYWKWAFSFPVATNPLLDTTGEFAHLGDVGGPVFFVAAGGAGTVSREFTVPGDRFLFFPMFTVAFYVGPGDTLADAQQFVDGLFATTTELHASVDGVPIPDLFSRWEVSPVFSLTIPPDGLGAPGVYTEAYSGGFWIMLQPLPAGQHTLVFGGDNPAIGFTTETMAVVNVVPEPGSIGLMLLGGAGLLAARIRRLKRPE